MTNRDDPPLAASGARCMDAHAGSLAHQARDGDNLAAGIGPAELVRAHEAVGRLQARLVNCWQLGSSAGRWREASEDHLACTCTLTDDNGTEHEWKPVERAGGRLLHDAAPAVENQGSGGGRRPEAMRAMGGKERGGHRESGRE